MGYNSCKKWIFRSENYSDKIGSLLKSHMYWTSTLKLKKVVLVNDWQKHWQNLIYANFFLSPLYLFLSREKFLFFHRSFSALILFISFVHNHEITITTQ